MSHHKKVTQAFDLTIDKLFFEFGLVGVEWKMKRKDERLIMEVFTPKGNFSLGLIAFFMVKDSIQFMTFSGLDRKPINKMLNGIKRTVNKKAKV